MTLRQAARRIVERAGRPMRAVEVARLMEVGGRPPTGNYALHSLRRLMATDEAFRRVEPGLYVWAGTEEVATADG